MAVDLAREMGEWEIHALRSLVATILFTLELVHSDPSEGTYTPAGAYALCDEAWQEFQRMRMLAFTDRDFRLAVIRGRPGAC